MSDCCAPADAAATATCPASNTQGRQVSLTTIAALLLTGTKARLRPDWHYFFCPEPACPVVYYAADDDDTITVSDLAVPVWQKSPHDPTVPVCYCFGHTAASIAEELQRTGQSTVLAAITTKVKADLCACKTRNPQGTCCLGNVATVVRLAAKQAAVSPKEISNGS